jgi:hypothetical protein
MFISPARSTNRCRDSINHQKRVGGGFAARSTRAGIHSQIFVVLLLVLCSCYSQSHLAIGVWRCYGFLTPNAIFLWGEECLFGNSSILFYLKELLITTSYWYNEDIEKIVFVVKNSDIINWGVGYVTYKSFYDTCIFSELIYFFNCMCVL